MWSFTVVLTPEIVDEIIYEYKRTRSPFKTARLVGVSATDVWEVIEHNSDRLAVRSENFGGFGNPAMRQFIVARRMITQDRSWDNDAEAIATARAAYEAGTHNMATGRDGDWLLLYSIPNKRLVPRPNYFKPEYI